MLVLSRQCDETIMIGDDIEVMIVDIRGDKVRLGINAPKSIPVHRKEVYDAIKRENKAAAAENANPPEQDQYATSFPSLAKRGNTNHVAALFSCIQLQLSPSLDTIEYMLIDTHTHLNFNAFKDDRDEVIKQTLKESVWMINVGSQYSTSKRAVEIGELYEQGMYAAIGMHPIHVKSDVVKVRVDPEEGGFVPAGEVFDAEAYRKLASSKKVVAIGEIGLDYYYKPKSKSKREIFKEKQKEVFAQQLVLAQELNLPVILHCRVAHDDVLEILEKLQKQIRGVVHCFTGSWEQAQRYMALGLSIGFTGIIFKLPLDEIVQKMPLESMLIETDCPYLVPPQAGTERNEPRFVRYIAERIAELKREPYEEIAEITTTNARTLFNI